MPKVAGKNGKKIRYVRFSITMPTEDLNFVDEVVGIKDSDRSKIIAKIVRERRMRSAKKLLAKGPL